MTLLKRSNRDLSIINIKIRILFFALFLGILTLWIRDFYIQIVWRKDLLKKSSHQYWKKELVNGPRGEIFTSDDVLVATSVILNSVFAVPKDIDNIDKTSRNLAKILDLSPGYIKKKLKTKRNFVWLKRRISDKQAKKIADLHPKGIHLTEEMARVYPQKIMAGQLIGFVGVDNQGLEGLEKSLDKQLSGEKKYFLVQRDGRGHLLYAPGQLKSSIAGKDIELTLDSRIQTICEKALAAGVKKNRGNYGIALVVEVKTGNILAWAQYPFFNPNSFRNSSPAIWRNRIALDMFEPGSTIKPLIVVAAMENKVCNLNKIYYCEKGKWKFEDVIIRDTHPHSWLSVSRIIRYSSNIGAAKIGLDIGAQKLFAFLNKIGFGSTTRLPLPGEAKGIFRDVSEWTKVDLANISFGQGISTTALQLVRAYLIIANHGVFTPLHLIEDYDDNNQRKRVISRRVSDAILDVLKDVVEKDGTGRLARIEGMEIGGKTGTSQKVEHGKYSRKKYVACFIGLYPALDPKYLAFVLVDEPKENIYGGVVAAPIVREIFKKIFPLDTSLTQGPLNRDVLEAIDSKNKDKNSPLFYKKVIFKGSKMPDLKGMCLREVIHLLSKKHVIFEVRNKGPVVVKQYPKEGSSLKGKKVILWMGNN
ncbi:penicillin-binding transpeptidase domain-containing protein [Desulfothermus naphthae]